MAVHSLVLLLTLFWQTEESQTQCNEVVRLVTVEQMTVNTLERGCFCLQCYATCICRPLSSNRQRINTVPICLFWPCKKYVLFEELSSQLQVLVIFLLLNVIAVQLELYCALVQNDSQNKCYKDMINIIILNIFTFLTAGHRGKVV